MRAALAILAAVLIISGCASSGATGPLLARSQLDAAVVPGQSTRAQVSQALGPATSVSFDNGYQVWMYRFKPANGKASSFGRASDGSGEFVILFRPDGVVAKTRTREQ